MATQFCGDPDLSPHKIAAQFCGDPELLDAGVSRASGTFPLLRLSWGVNYAAERRGQIGRYSERPYIRSSNKLQH
jgi:hypothetical protein